MILAQTVITNPNAWAVIKDILTILIPVFLAGIAYIQFRFGKKAEAAQLKAQEDREDARIKLTEAAGKIEAVKDTLQIQGSAQSQQLNIIHSLGNAQLTSSIHNERDAKVNSLIFMQEVVDLRKEFKQQPTKETLAAIAVMKAEIATLDRILEERRIQQDVIDSKIAQKPEVAEVKIVNTIDQPVPVVPPA